METKVHVEWKWGGGFHPDRISWFVTRVYIWVVAGGRYDRGETRLTVSIQRAL